MLFVSGESRARWPKYDEYMTSRDAWAGTLLDTFRKGVRTVREAFVSNSSPSHVYSPLAASPLHPTAPAAGSLKIPPANLTLPQNLPSNVGVGASPRRKDASSAPPKKTEMLEMCFVFRLEDFALYRVTTALDDKRSTPKKFISSDKKQLFLPSDMSSIHVEYTEYYFPGGREFPSKYIMRLVHIRFILEFFHQMRKKNKFRNFFSHHFH